MNHSLLPIIKQLNDARCAGKKILDILKEPTKIDGQEVFSFASIGISTFPKDGKTAAVLIQNADMAMYQSKGRGCNNYCVYTPDLGVKSTAFE